VNGATAGERQTQRVRHRSDLQAARARLPRRPLPGERNFTGVPPAGETRFVSTEMVFQVGPGVSRQTIDDLAARLGLTVIGAQRSALAGGTLFHFRLAGGRRVADVVRALEAERIGVAQPNYVYRVGQNEPPDARQDAAGQYVADKLRLAEAHKIATGKGVLVAVIDSAIDGQHPDLGKAIVKKFDPAGGGKPHAHGTGMVGAIAAHGRLTGIAPDASVLAVHAFSTTAKQSPQATTRNIVAGLEWALDNKARVINMSFAGPHDPMLQLAMKKAHEKGVVLIAAMGNQGAKSPPLYPAADPHVIAVTATDENDALYDRANRGPHVAVAAPGVDIMAAAPDGTYQMTTGTSVAAAHVSGVAALLIERHPTVDAKTVLEVLTASATKLGADARDDQFGFGLIDPASALEELDARIADAKVAAPAATPVAAPAKPVLPRPGVYAPR
jgi:subtilisin family serine protease